MKQTVGYVSLLVRGYDEALAYYCGIIGFRVAEDTALGRGERWVLVGPPGSQGTKILLARGKN